MGKSTGFLEYERKDANAEAPLLRVKHFNEFKTPLSVSEQRIQGARCMECGVPFCQYGGDVGGMASGCPLHNLVPETNDLVYTGNWEQAYKRLTKTHCFPEFTGRVCPALCEAACTCGLEGQPVATKENEKAIIERAFSLGWVKACPPAVRTGKHVAVIGSGPAGLAAAMMLNKRGHYVTIFERSDAPGGLLRYGIPNMKLEKQIVDRRIRLMEEEGIEFKTGVDVGKDIKVSELLKKYDRILLACGASEPRDLNVPGRDAKNILFAVDFLGQVTKALVPEKAQDHSRAAVMHADPHAPVVSLVKGKNVLVIGGGDTGNDCVGTAVRLGARSVIQLEMMPEPPKERAANNPWPEWPRVKKTDYGQEEAAAVYGSDPRVYQTTVAEFIKDDHGNVCKAKIIRLIPKKDDKSGRMQMVPEEGSEKLMDVQLVLIAAGFTGAQKYVTDAFKVSVNNRGSVMADEVNFQTTAQHVFAAGDMRRGQSLVVWAIREGREAARAIDRSLMGYTNL